MNRMKQGLGQIMNNRLNNRFMNQSRVKSNKKQDIIDISKTRKYPAYELLITALGWGYIITQTVQILASAALWLFGAETINTTVFSDRSAVSTLLLTFTAALMWFLLSYGWGQYNYRKFAHLNRRTFPGKSNNADIHHVTGLSRERIQELQAMKVIVLEETIV